MSLLLDALRKSAHERRLGSAPGLEDGLRHMAPAAPRRRSWLSPVLLLAILVFLGIWQPWRTPGDEVSEAVADADTRAAPDESGVTAGAAAADTDRAAAAAGGQNTGGQNVAAARSADPPAAAKWEGDLVFVVEPGPGLNEARHLYMDLWHGECRSAGGSDTGDTCSSPVRRPPDR